MTVSVFVCFVFFVYFVFFFFFFFQAEDGIRDAQESRGLGDVYKRQLESCLSMHLMPHGQMKIGDIT